MPLPPDRKAIGWKWVFQLKENADGLINKFKARFVAKGFNQVQGFDFSPVVKPVTIRLILTLAVINQWKLFQLDVNNAFLNGLLNESVYMSQPPGFKDSNSSLVWRLNRALYGLKQAPREWFERLQFTLIQFGFVASKHDPSLFIYAASVYLLVYVDDIIISGSSIQLIQQLTSQLNAKFSLKQLGQLDYFVGIEVKTLSDSSLLLTQSKYIRDLLQKTNMTQAQVISSPTTSSCKLTTTGSDLFTDPTMYRSVVGALQYLTITRPVISFAVNKVCQFMANPLDTHWAAVKIILRYLKGMVLYGLHLRPAALGQPYSIRALCDADWHQTLMIDVLLLVQLYTLVLISYPGGLPSRKLLQDPAQRPSTEV